MLTLKTRADLSIDAARTRLQPPASREAVLPALGAAALAAVSALVLAGAVILGPPGEVHIAAMTSQGS